MCAVLAPRDTCADKSRIFGFYKINDPPGFFLLLLTSEKSSGELATTAEAPSGMQQQSVRRMSSLCVLLAVFASVCSVHVLRTRNKQHGAQVLNSRVHWFGGTSIYTPQHLSIGTRVRAASHISRRRSASDELGCCGERRHGEQRVKFFVLSIGGYTADAEA